MTVSFGGLINKSDLGLCYFFREPFRDMLCLEQFRAMPPKQLTQCFSPEFFLCQEVSVLAVLVHGPRQSPNFLTACLLYL